jgi:hypothetical protein
MSINASRSSSVVANVTERLSNYTLKKERPSQKVRRTLRWREKQKQKDHSDPINFVSIVPANYLETEGNKANLRL